MFDLKVKPKKWDQNIPRPFAYFGALLIANLRKALYCKLSRNVQFISYKFCNGNKVDSGNSGCLVIYFSTCSKNLNFWEF